MVVSPHLNDAVFSVAAHLKTLADESITILTPFAGIPDDDSLRQEHANACQSLGFHRVDGPFSGGGDQTRAEVEEYLKPRLVLADKIYIPVGTHHPDHLLVTEAASNVVVQFSMRGMSYEVFYYEELPHRVLYSELVQERLAGCEGLELIETDSTPMKEAACRLYTSRVDDDLMAKLMVTERVWQ